jgi:hypothetical protein
MPRHRTTITPEASKDKNCPFVSSTSQGQEKRVEKGCGWGGSNSHGGFPPAGCYPAAYANSATPAFPGTSVPSCLLVADVAGPFLDLLPTPQKQKARRSQCAESLHTFIRREVIETLSIWNLRALMVHSGPVMMWQVLRPCAGSYLWRLPHGGYRRQ